MTDAVHQPAPDGIDADLLQRSDDFRFAGDGAQFVGDALERTPGAEHQQHAHLPPRQGQVGQFSLAVTAGQQAARHPWRQIGVAPEHGTHGNEDLLRQLTASTRPWSTTHA